ncbi:MAG TPA: hypothetical protein VEL51_22520 [Vicinamibacterales bacterium]|nr:hypothetical protein [Vicinamibacterales bacterium]
MLAAARRAFEREQPFDEVRRRQCVGKVRFPSKKNATARARLLTLADADRRLWMSYKCQRCRRWHIGHSSWT